VLCLTFVSHQNIVVDNTIIVKDRQYVRFIYHEESIARHRIDE